MPASLPMTSRPVRLGANRSVGIDHRWCGRIRLSSGGTEQDAIGDAEDLAEFVRVATLRAKPAWAHEAPEVGAWPIARLLDYSAPTGTTALPTLVLPPQAGHASSIVDYGRDQSQMTTLSDTGLDRLFAIDWLPATDETADWSIEGYVAVLEEAVQFLCGRVNLVGDCQGGWLVVVYAGLPPST